MQDGVIDDDVLELAGVKGKVKLPKSLQAEIGVATSMPTGSYGGFLDSGVNTRALSGDMVTAVTKALVPLDTLVEMRRKDGQARALLRLFVLPIMAALRDGKWVAPEEGGTKAAKEVAFANAMFSTPAEAGGMRTPIAKVLRQVLLSLSEGFTVFEEVRKIGTEGVLKGKIVIDKLALRDSRTLRFLVDKHGEPVAVRQIANVKGEVVDVLMPMDKVVHHVVNEEENPLYGVSYFETAWFHYEMKRRFYYLSQIAGQQAAVPGRIGEIPVGANPADVAAFRKTLADFGFNTAMTHPVGWKVTPFNSNSNFNFLELIDHQNKAMSKSVLAKFLDDEDRQVLIDNGKADASADLFVMALEGIMGEIASVWSNQLMPRYIDWNFGSGMYPKYEFGPMADSAKDALKELFEATVSASTLNCTPEFIREVEEKLATRLGLDIDYKMVAKRDAEERDQQAQAAADQAAQAAAQGAGGPSPDDGSGGTGPPAAGNGVPPSPGGPPGGGAPPAAAPAGGAASGGVGGASHGSQNNPINASAISLAAIAEEIERRRVEGVL